MRDRTDTWGIIFNATVIAVEDGFSDDGNPDLANPVYADLYRAVDDEVEGLTRLAIIDHVMAAR